MKHPLRLPFLLVLLVGHQASAQTFKRLGGCPTLGCVFPPDQTHFLPGAYFDIRVEVHAPVNGSEAVNWNRDGGGASGSGGAGVVDRRFELCIQRGKGACRGVREFFKMGKGEEPEVETWAFQYFEDLFARDENKPTVVNVASKIYRAVRLTKPGKYIAKLRYNGNMETIAHWVVRKPQPAPRKHKYRAKNVVFFIGDGMTQAMVTAARMLAHKSVNGRYQSLMEMDKMEYLGHQMTHSLDSYITDSANSASAMFTGHKTHEGALNVYVDSSASSLDDPKSETIAELWRRRRGGQLGIVSTAEITDATPAALCAHTRSRLDFTAIAYEFLYGASGKRGLNATWAWPTSCREPDVLFGGGAEYFVPGPTSPNETDFYDAFRERGYKVVHTNAELKNASIYKKTLGIFSKSLLATWLDRHIYPENLKNKANSPTGDGSDAADQPGLKAMTLKAIDILHQRQKRSGKGFFLMSEAALIDKMMHRLDYDRALGELLELDDTIGATIAHLKKLGELEDTLIIVTADHGHGFDVYGSADTKYLAAQTDDRKKRDAIGYYGGSGLSGYTVASGSLPNNDTIVIGSQGPNFPVQWNPRYTFAGGMAAHPDIREGFVVNTEGIRTPAVPSDHGYVQNPQDQPSGFNIPGTLPVGAQRGVHSMQDVSVYANGPGAEAFRGFYDNTDIFFKLADVLGLAETD